MKKDYSPQAKFQKEKMSVVKGSYKNDFVDEFKNACSDLNKTQSDVIRKAMEETIKQREFLQFKKDVESSINNCKKFPDDEANAKAIIKYNAYLKLVDETTEYALANNFNWYIIEGDVYITDGIQRFLEIREASFVKKVEFPKYGTEVFIVDEPLPFTIETEETYSNEYFGEEEEWI